jgi:hypothetical protein
VLAGEYSVGYRNARLWDGVAHSRSLPPTTAEWDNALPTTAKWERTLRGIPRCPQRLSGISCCPQQWERMLGGMPRTCRARRAHTSRSKSQSRTAPPAACSQPYNEGGITMPRPQAIQRRTGCHRAHHEGCRTYAEGVRYLPPATTAYRADWDTDVKSSAIVSRVISAWSNAARLRTAPRPLRELRSAAMARGARAPVVYACARRRAVRQRDRLIPVGQERPSGNFRARKLFFTAETSEAGNFPTPERTFWGQFCAGAGAAAAARGAAHAQRSVDSAGLSKARIYFSRH